MTVALVGEVVNSADATTGFSSGNISGDDDFVEGTGAIGVKASATLAEMYTTTLGAGAPYDFSSGGPEEGFHYIGWYNTKTPVEIAPLYGGLRVVAGNGTDRGHWFVDPDGFYKGGFITVVIDPTARFDVIQAGTWTLSGNPAQLSNITQLGGAFDTTTSIMGSFNNVQLDQFTIGLGLRADGEGNSFEVVRAQDEDTDFFGWWSSKNGAIVGKGKLFIGPESGSATCTFIDRDRRIVFAAERVAEGFYEILAEGADTDIQWTRMGIAAAKPLRTYSIANVGFRKAIIDISGEDLSPTGLFFEDDGTRVFFMGNTGDDVNWADLSTAWDLNSVGTWSQFSVSGDTTSPSSIFFSPDGTEMFYCDSSADVIYQRTLSTAWLPSSAGVSSSFDVSADEQSLSACFVSPDGKRIYYGGSTGSPSDAVRERILSTAWDITSAGSLNASYVTAGIVPGFNSITDIHFNPEGTKMFVTAELGDMVIQVPLGTPWDLATAGDVEAVLDLEIFTNTAPQSIFFGDGGRRLFILDSSFSTGEAIMEVNTDKTTRWSFTVDASTLNVDDTDGSLSGSDVITLDDSVTFLRTTLLDGTSLVQNGATMTDITVLEANTQLGEAYIQSDAPNLITGGSFTFSEGHALELTTHGEYTFSGNAFVGFGPGSADGTGVHDHEFDTITDVDAGADTITITGDPFVTTDPVYYVDSGSPSDDIGLISETRYYVRRTAASTYSIHPNAAAALNGVDALDLSDGSTGEAHTLYSARAAIYNNSGGTVTLNIAGGGDTPSIRNSEGSVTEVNNNTTVTFDGMRDDSEVWVFPTGVTGEGNEIAMIENAIAGSVDDRSFAWSAQAGIGVDYIIHSWDANGPDYQYIRVVNFIVPNDDLTIDINQLLDRNSV